VIEKFMWNKERGFDFDKLGKYPIFEDTFKQKGWEGIAKMVTEWGNATIAREFLVNALAEKESDAHAYVRGKKVNYSAAAIRRVLKLRAVETCDVEARKNTTGVFRSRAEWDILLEGLMREGKGWIGTVDRPQRINTAELLPEYKAWASFILTVIDQTSSTAEMTRDRVLILLSVISDEEMDVAVLMYKSLKKLISSPKQTLGHCCLINKLCEAAKVPTEPFDVYEKSLGFVSESVMRSFERDQAKYEKNYRQMQEQQGQPQMMEQDGVPQVQPPQVQQGLPPHFAEFTYAMANWAQDISSSLRMPLPAFSEEFILLAADYRREPDVMTDAYSRFASPIEMEKYFDEERKRGAEREERIREEYYRIASEQPDADSQPRYYPSGPGGSSRAQQ
jgi:hypothetical protein